VRRRAYSGDEQAIGAQWLLAVLVCVLAVLLWGLIPAGGGRREAPMAALGAEAGSLWRAVCGRCHVAFDPYFLPLAAWERVLAGLPDHFGAVVALEAAELVQLRGWVGRKAADAGRSVIGAEVMRRLAPSDRPRRVTETRWFRHRHHRIPRATWTRPAIGSAANCVACHLDADRGIFSARSVFVPG